MTVLAMGMSLLVSSVVGQDKKDKENEVTGIVGGISISDQGIVGAAYRNPFVRSGKGFTFELNYARRLYGTQLYAISGEVPLLFNLDEDLGSGGNVVPQDYQQVFVTPAVRFNLFPETRVSPWVSFGGGFGHFSENNTLIYGGTNPGTSSTSGVIQGGLGVDVKMWHSLSLRGQVRDFWSGTPDLPLAPTGKARQHNYFLGGGVVWHFF